MDASSVREVNMRLSANGIKLGHLGCSDRGSIPRFLIWVRSITDSIFRYEREDLGAIPNVPFNHCLVSLIVEYLIVAQEKSGRYRHLALTL